MADVRATAQTVAICEYEEVMSFDTGGFAQYPTARK
jgi:hypothetical protein